MKISIDEKKCLKHKLTIEELLVALMYRQVGNLEAVSENLVNREVLTKQDGRYLVTQRWSDEIDDILCESTGNLNDNRLEALAKKIQELFPSGFKQDERTGTKYYHKSNKLAITQALKRFITNYGDYSDDVILDATKRYVASFRGNYAPPFQMANYFVYKDLRSKGGDITSQLATFIENKESDEEGVVEVNTDDWTANVKN